MQSNDTILQGSLESNKTLYHLRQDKIYISVTE